MSTTLHEYAGRVLKVNLSDRTYGDFPWTDADRERTLGGKIMAAEILYNHVRPGMTAFDEENWVVVTTGPLTGNGCPCSSRFNISTISPLTGILTSSNCGGDFGMSLKRAGYDGVIFTGKSDTPVHVEITNEKVLFHDASGLWGLTTSETQRQLDRKHGKLVIGPTGENKVLYSGVFSGERTAGRGGVGAVFGDKGLKAVTAWGKFRPKAYDPEKLKKLNRKWAEDLMANPLTGKMFPELGTAALVAPLQRAHMLSTRNFTSGRFDDYEAITGETMREDHLVKNIGCRTCVIRCGRQVEVDEKLVKGPELETLVLLGPNLMNDDLERIIRWNYELDELGMDTISAAGTIAFAMELNEKGLWDSGLEFGKTDNLSEAFHDIAYRRGNGDILADGSRRMAERFGGEDFAMQVKGMEFAAYEPRGSIGIGLGYATSNRGACHINGGYLVAVEVFATQGVALSKHAKAALSIMLQDVSESVSAQGTCVLSAFGLFPSFLVKDLEGVLLKVALLFVPFLGPVINILNRFPEIAPINIPFIPYTYAIRYATGMKMNFAKYLKIGKRGVVTERATNIILGQGPDADVLPARLTDVEQIPGDARTTVPLDYMLKIFHRVRGWKRGIPSLFALLRAGVAVPRYEYPDKWVSLWQRFR